MIHGALGVLGALGALGVGRRAMSRTKEVNKGLDMLLHSV